MGFGIVYVFSEIRETKVHLPTERTQLTKVQLGFGPSNKAEQKLALKLRRANDFFFF